MVHSEHLTDRELSWLSFDQRVLEMAEDAEVPLLERVRFLSIFASNLDEFFMVRVATLKSKIDAEIKTKNSAGFTPMELMRELSLRVHDLVERQSRCLHESILPALTEHGISLVSWDDLDETEKTYTAKLFDDRIFPVLTSCC